MGGPSDPPSRSPRPSRSEELELLLLEGSGLPPGRSPPSPPDPDRPLGRIGSSSNVGIGLWPGRAGSFGGVVVADGGTDGGFGPCDALPYPQELLCPPRVSTALLLSDGPRCGNLFQHDSSSCPFSLQNLQVGLGGFCCPD